PSGGPPLLAGDVLEVADHLAGERDVGDEAASGVGRWRGEAGEDARRACGVEVGQAQRDGAGPDPGVDPARLVLALVAADGAVLVLGGGDLGRVAAEVDRDGAAPVD